MFFFRGRSRTRQRAEATVALRQRPSLISKSAPCVPAAFAASLRFLFVGPTMVSPAVRRGWRTRSTVLVVLIRVFRPKHNDAELDTSDSDGSSDSGRNNSICSVCRVCLADLGSLTCASVTAGCTCVQGFVTAMVCLALSPRPCPAPYFPCADQKSGELLCCDGCPKAFHPKW